MAETPTQTLRRAAEKLRTLANAATPGPWTLRTDDFNVAVVGPHSSIYHRDGSPGSHADALYVAALHPGVALALADWLDAEAAVHEAGMQASEALCVVVEAAGAGEHRVQVHASTLDQAHALTRAILGEETAR